MEAIFEIHALLGAGSYGGVFRSTYVAPTNSHEQKTFAMKIGRRSVKPCCDENLLCQCVLDETEEARIRAHGIAHEVAILTALSHPNIIRIEATGMWCGLPCYVMPMAEYSLNDMQHNRGDCAPHLALYAAIQLFSALTYLHESCSIAHCDVTPRNILVMAYGPDFQLQLSDFGAARRIDLRSGRILEALSEIPFCCTTHHTASPQCFFRDGEDNDATKCDVWAAAVSVLALGGLWHVFPFKTPADDAFHKVLGPSLAAADKVALLAPFVSSTRLAHLLVNGPLMYHESRRQSAKQCLVALLSQWQE